MAYSESELAQALVNADKAGDTQAATTIAGMIRDIRSKPKMADNGASWGGVDNFAHGVLQGLGDEVKAAAAASKDKIAGMPGDWSNLYDQALGMYRGAKEQYRDEHPVAALATEGGGALASGLAGGGALKAAGVALPKAATLGSKVLQNAGIGAAQGGLYGANEGEGGAWERLKSGLSGSASGGFLGGLLPAAGAAVGRVVQPVRAALNSEEARLATLAMLEGIGLTPAQLSGSRPLKIMESVFKELPWTASTQKEIEDTQRGQFNRAILKRAGIEGESAAPGVLENRFNELGSVFNDLSGRNAVQADETLMRRLGEVEKSYKLNLEPDQQGIVGRYIQAIKEKLSPTSQEFRDTQTHPGTTIIHDVEGPGYMMGEDYQKLRSALTTRARNATDPEFRFALKGIRNALDDAASRSVSAEDSAAWDTARRQYANLKTIERAMNNTQLPTMAGNIQPTALGQAVQASAKGLGSSFARGGADDLNDLARIGSAFVRDSTPNSGTAQRQFMQHLLTGGAAGGAGYLTSEDPTTGLAAAAAGFAGPKLAQKFYNSVTGGSYLGNKIIDKLIPVDRRRALAQMLAEGGGVYGGVNDQY